MIKEKSRILITGSNGLLGQKLAAYFQKKGINYLATSKGENRISFIPKEDFYSMDITDVEAIHQVIIHYNPTHIINTAAMTNVDKCEEEIEKAFKINGYALENFYRIIQGRNIHFIQISTDFIFDGKQEMYLENDTPHPLGEYGKSKLKGEEIIQRNHHYKSTILRTSLVYGIGEALQKGNIFIWAMKELRKGNPLRIVNDQFRTPTFVDDLVKACVLCIEKEAKGIYNIASEKRYSMFELIQLVAHYLNINPTQFIEPISSKELNQLAKRPPSSGLTISKAQRELGFHPTRFEDTLPLIDDEKS